MSETTSAVLCEKRGHALWITINRPDKRNAINADVIAGIRARIADEVGLADVDVRLVARGWLPRTSSGKWRRGEVRERLFADSEV